MSLAADVRIVNPTRRPYVGRTGLVVKRDMREGKPYLGVDFPGIFHVVWFFESEVELINGMRHKERK